MNFYQKQSYFKSAVASFVLATLGACTGVSSGKGPLYDVTQKVVLQCDDPVEGKVELLQSGAMGIHYIYFKRPDGTSLYENLNGQNLSAFLLIENSEDSLSGHTSYFPQEESVLSYDELVFETVKPFQQIDVSRVHWVKDPEDGTFNPEPDAHFQSLSNCSAK